MTKILLKNISTPYGQVDRWHKKPHAGTDITGARGMKIPAVSDGIVVNDNYKLDPTGYGNRVVVKLLNGDTEHYAHLDQSSHLKHGDNVSVGDLIGYVGSTGNSTGSHLHYEVRKPNNKHTAPEQDKVDYLNRAINQHENDCEVFGEWVFINGKYVFVRKG